MKASEVLTQASALIERDGYLYHLLDNAPVGTHNTPETGWDIPGAISQVVFGDPNRFHDPTFQLMVGLGIIAPPAEYLEAYERVRDAMLKTTEELLAMSQEELLETEPQSQEDALSLLSSAIWIATAAEAATEEDAA